MHAGAVRIDRDLRRTFRLPGVIDRLANDQPPPFQAGMLAEELGEPRPRQGGGEDDTLGPDGVQRRLRHHERELAERVPVLDGPQGRPAGSGQHLHLALGDDLKRVADLAGPEEDGARLSRRQREVLQLIAEGRTMKEVATILDISQRPAESHTYAMMEVLGVKTTADLIRYAVKLKLVPE